MVDDEGDIVRLVSQVLTSSGFEVCAYTDPRAVLQDLKPNYYHVIIVDVRMSFIDGFALYHEIRKIETSAPICFFTAYDTAAERFAHEIEKADHNAILIRKPTNLKAFAIIIRNLTK